MYRRGVPSCAKLITFLQHTNMTIFVGVTTAASRVTHQIPRTNEQGVIVAGSFPLCAYVLLYWHCCLTDCCLSVAGRDVRRGSGVVRIVSPDDRRPSGRLLSILCGDKKRGIAASPNGQPRSKGDNKGGGREGKDRRRIVAFVYSRSGSYVEISSKAPPL